VIHGYGNPKEVMNKIDNDLLKAGFYSENYAYPGFTEDLDSLGQQLYLDIIAQGLDTVSFVTHSMGGLVFRTMLKYSGLDPDFPVIYRVVMIAPPNQGADIADFFKENEKYKKVLGPNVEKMETDSNSYANQLPVPINIEVGIIIGARGKEIGYNALIEGDNDGLLKPERTRLGNEKDFITLKYDHFALTQKKKSRKHVVEFLWYGEFFDH
jgi:uncharacterized alpha/beta hydrolase family protein